MTSTAFGTQLRNGQWDVVAGQTTASFTVRKLGLIRVHGTIEVDDGYVIIAGGQPVAAAATLQPASVSTGINKRDMDLGGKHFFATAEHPRMLVRIRDVRADDDGWSAAGTITVAGRPSPIELHVVRQPDVDAGTIRVLATGVLDRSTTLIGAPRLLVGRWVQIEVAATLRQPSS